MSTVAHKATYFMFSAWDGSRVYGFCDNGLRVAQCATLIGSGSSKCSSIESPASFPRPHSYKFGSSLIIALLTFHFSALSPLQHCVWSTVTDRTTIYSGRPITIIGLSNAQVENVGGRKSRPRGDKNAIALHKRQC